MGTLTQPREPFHHARRYGVIGQKRRDQVDDEEKQPTSDEPSDDDGQRLRGLVLALERHPAIVTSPQAAVARIDTTK